MSYYDPEFSLFFSLYPGKANSDNKNCFLVPFNSKIVCFDKESYLECIKNCVLLEDLLPFQTQDGFIDI